MKGARKVEDQTKENNDGVEGNGGGRGNWGEQEGNKVEMRKKMRVEEEETKESKDIK